MSYALKCLSIVSINFQDGVNGLNVSANEMKFSDQKGSKSLVFGVASAYS